jgi:TP901 family phage tail tape measure protein
VPGRDAELRIAIRAVNEAKAALGEVQADLRALQDAADQANGRFGAVGAALSGLGSSMQTVGKYAMAGMAAGIGAVAGGLGLALKSSADFERQLTIVASVAGATGSELAALRQTALDLGESTAYSAGEVTQAMEVLAANGISAKDIVEGAARAALDLAAAGSTSLVQAADTVSTAMAVWGLSTADLTDTVNRLAGAANVSRFGVEDMSLAIAQGGGAASAAGVEFADFAAAIAGIAPLFASGSDAGTSFKTFIQRLVPDSKPAREAMMELGLITADGANKFFDATGKMRPMAEVVDELNRAVSRLSEEDRTRLLSNAFGTDAMRTAIGLSRMTKEEFIALQTAMGEASAAEIGQQRMQGLAGAMEQFKGALETARIEIGDRLNPIATRFFEALAGVVPTLKEGILNAMDRFSADVLPRLQAALDGVRSAWDRFREPILQFLQSKEAAQLGLGMLAAVLLSVAVAAGSAAAGMLAAVAPVAALGLAIGGVIIVADKLGVDWGRVWDGIREAAGRAADWLVPKVQAFAEAAGSALRRFGSYWETELKPAIERVVAFLSAAFEKIEPVIRPVIEGVISAFQSFASMVAENVKLVLEIVGRLVDVVVQLIQGDWSSAWNSAKEIVKLAIELVLNLLRSVPEQLGAIMGGLLEAGKALLGALADGLRWAWENHIWPFIQDIPNKVLSGFTGAGQWLYDIGKDILRGLWDGLKAMWGEVEGWLGGIGGKIKSIKGPPEKDRVLLYDIGRMIMEGLSNGLFDGWSEDTVKRLKEISRGLVRNYEDAVKDLENHTVPDWRQLGELLSAALAQGHFDGFKKNKPLLEQVSAALTASAGQAATAVGDELARVLNMTGKRLDQALLEIRDLMVRNLEAGRELSVQEVRTLLGAMEEMLESPTLPEAAKHLGQKVINELIESLKAGKGAANEVIAQLADELAKAAAQGAKAAAAGGAGTASAPAGPLGWKPDEGGTAPVGAHGVQLVWDDRAQAWVYPWEKGSVRSPQERQAYMESWARGETLAGAIPAVRTEVSVQIDGREVARAAADAAGRQSFAWGV